MNYLYSYTGLMKAGPIASVTCLSSNKNLFVHCISVHFKTCSVESYSILVDTKIMRILLESCLLSRV